MDNISLKSQKRQRLCAIPMHPEEEHIQLLIHIFHYQLFQNASELASKVKDVSLLNQFKYQR